MTWQSDIDDELKKRLGNKYVAPTVAKSAGLNKEEIDKEIKQRMESIKAKPSQIAREEQQTKTEEQKPSFIQKVKTGITKIGEAISGKKKIEQQVQQTKEQTQQYQTLLQKVSTAQINQQKLKQNILDDQINRMKSFDSVTSADLTPGAKKKVEEITQPIFTEAERLGEKAKTTETKDWRDRVYESLTTGKDVPFAGDLNQIPETVQLLQASTRLREGKATADDAKLLKDWLDQQNRDSTFGYKVTDTLLQSLKFGAELYTTAGAYTFGKETAKKGIKYLMGKAGKEATEELLEKFGYKVAAGVVGETVRTAVQAPIKITQSTLEKQIASNLEVVAGITDSKESVGQSLIKSFSEAWVENVSERAGDAIGLGVKELSEPLKQKLVKTAIFNTLNKAISNNTNAITKYLAKAGYDGILNEMLEERIGDAMNGLLYEVGMSDQEFQLPTKEQLLVELVSFSIPGVVSKASEVITTRLDKIDANTIKMTPEAARDTVNLSNLSGTPAGNEILKAADVADKDGKMVLVDLKGNTGNKTETTEKNIIGVSVSEEKVAQQKEPQVTQEKDVTSPEALELKKQELMKKVSVGKQGETIKTEETTKKLTNEEITQLKELAKASNTAKSFLDKIGPVNAQKIKSSGESIIGFYNNASQPIKEEIKETKTERVLLEKAKQYNTAEEFINSTNYIDNGFNEWFKTVWLPKQSEQTQKAWTEKIDMIDTGDTAKAYTNIFNREYKPILSDMWNNAQKKPIEEQKQQKIVEKEVTEVKKVPSKEKSTEEIKKVVPPLKEKKGITKKQREEAIKKPIEETEGKPKLSKVAQRVLDKLVDVKDYDVTYQPMNIVEDAAKAAEFVDQNPELSLKIAKGLELPPPDITETAISIAAAQKALDNKDYLLYTRLILSRTFRQTRRGQEIVAERGRQDENSTEFFMKKLLEERARLVTKGKTWLFEKEKGVQKIIAKEVQKVKTDMDKKVLRKLESAQKLIDSLTCKI